MAGRDIILSLDIGTSNIKLAAVAKTGEIVRLHKRALRLKCPQPGYQEICPTELWDDIESLFKSTCEGIESRIAALGISTHRSTFITWERDTDNYLHNFITWADQRAKKMCDNWNNGYIVRIGQSILQAVGTVVGSTHMICIANFKVQSANVQMRLKWVMENIAAAKPLHDKGNLCFGTLDTWIIYKLTGKATWATDYTNAAATGIYDMWGDKWCPAMAWVFSLPIESLPEVRNSNASFGQVSSELNLGFSVPIHGIMADQQASVFGNHLFEEGDVKLSLGTGIACDRLTGSYVHPVAMSVYPQIAWKLTGSEIFYMAESMTMELRGKYLDWLVSAKLVDSIEEINNMALSVKSSETPLFLKKDGVNEVPIEEFMVEKSNCTNAHFVRAVMEAHVFRAKILLDDVFDFYGRADKIIVDGGASSSQFILESLCAVTGIDVYRSNCVEGALMGAFYVAGLGLGWWNSLEDISLFTDLTQISPLKEEDGCTLLEKFEKWKTLTKY